jgi:aspartokinase/homoserine dehydrogenase 1
VFIDCTASEKIADSYISLMQNRISLVAANKIANTKPMSMYEELKKTANQYKVHFLYETNAGAGLPIIDPIRNLKDTGDKIQKFEAILSGTISYLFNQLTESGKFSDIVKKARDLGYTEPDPRVDLSGIDFARKILLLVREFGIDMEFEDIRIEPLLSPYTSEDVSLQEFYQRLVGEDERYSQLVQKAKEKGCVIRWIGKYENGRASIKLEWVSNEHPFFTLKGTDNIIAIYTNRYTNPLVIKGAGAGAEVTAGGVMSDVFRIANAMNKRWDY